MESNGRIIPLLCTSLPLTPTPLKYSLFTRTMTRPDGSPYLRNIAQLMAAHPLSDRLCLWCATDRCVRGNAWQMALACDTRRNFLKGIVAGEGELPALAFYDWYLDRLTNHLPGRLAAALLTWLWLRWNCLQA